MNTGLKITTAKPCFFKAFAQYKRSDETGVNQVRTVQKKLNANGQEFTDHNCGIYE